MTLNSSWPLPFLIRTTHPRLKWRFQFLTSLLLLLVWKNRCWICLLQLRCLTFKRRRTKSFSAMLKLLRLPEILRIVFYTDSQRILKLLRFWKMMSLSMSLLKLKLLVMKSLLEWKNLKLLRKKSTGSELPSNLLLSELKFFSSLLWIWLLLTLCTSTRSNGSVISLVHQLMAHKNLLTMKTESAFWTLTSLSHSMITYVDHSSRRISSYSL